MDDRKPTLTESCLTYALFSTAVGLFCGMLWATRERVTKRATGRG